MRLEAPELSRGAAESRLTRGFSGLLNRLSSEPQALEEFVGALNDWLITHPRFGGAVGPLEPQNRSEELPMIIINPARPL